MNCALHFIDQIFIGIHLEFVVPEFHIIKMQPNNVYNVK